MTEQTANVKAFLRANAESPVVNGWSRPGGGGGYTLKSGKSYSFTLKECRSMPMPIWVTD